MRGILRSHPYRIFVPAAAVVVVGAPSLVLFAFESRTAMIAQVGLSTALVFALLLALAAAASSVTREREAGLSDLLRARGIGTAEWLLGKWLGITACVALSVATLGAVHLVSVALRGGPAAGYAPLVAALLAAVVEGGLAAAAGIFFALRLRSGPAFLGGLLLVLAGHAGALLGDTAPAQALRFLLPRSGALNLGGEAAFGPLPPTLWFAAVLHGLLYTAFLLAASTLLATREN